MRGPKKSEAGRLVLDPPVFKAILSGYLSIVCLANLIYNCVCGVCESVCGTSMWRNFCFSENSKDSVNVKLRC